MMSFMRLLESEKLKNLKNKKSETISLVVSDFFVYLCIKLNVFLVMSGLNTTFGGIGWAIGRLEFWNWFLSVDCVVKLANRKHIFGNFFWRNGDI